MSENMLIREGMEWPPTTLLRHKMAEHSAWYSGDPNLLSTFYAQVVGSQVLNLPYTTERDMFWRRQIRNDVELGLHIPIASDIASNSADILFSEAPMIKITEAHEKNAQQSMKDTQEELNNMLDRSGFYQRILAAAEVSAAIGGVYIKLAWDEELSPYPIPVVEQADNAYPVFRFGILTKVQFVKTVKAEKQGSAIFRLVETYANNGTIMYELYKGTSDKLGNSVPVTTIDETKDIVNLDIGIKEILCVFVPNVLPNRYDRTSYFGRSDYASLEGLMDCLDETYSSWMMDIAFARGKILVPEEFIEKTQSGFKFNIDKSVYVKLDMDPTIEGNKITAVQFDIRADKFEKTALNLLERIVTGAGYSPQSFGLNIQGRAESGTALNIRERKTFATKNKKEAYWEGALKKLTQLMLIVYNTRLGGKVEMNVTVTTQFSDSISNDIGELSEAVMKIANAMAASTETKVRLIHPEWSEDEVLAEVKKIIDENGLMPEMDPDKLGVDEGDGNFGGDK